MKIALLDFHRRKYGKAGETHKIKVALERHDSAEVDVFEMMAPQAPAIPVREYSGFVLGGADSNHVERYPGYRAARRFVAEAAELGRPVLGVCAGHQLLGRMHGWEIGFMEEPEAGWYEIRLTDDGTADPLFRGISGRFVSYQSHIKYVIPGADSAYTVLAENRNCLQAYRYRTNVYGIQFHPEETIESGEDLIRSYDRRPPTVRDRTGMPERLEGRILFKNFVDIVAAR